MSSPRDLNAHGNVSALSETLEVTFGRAKCCAVRLLWMPSSESMGDHFKEVLQLRVRVTVWEGALPLSKSTSLGQRFGSFCQVKWCEREG